MKKQIGSLFAVIAVTASIILLLGWLLSMVHWGTITVASPKTITVTGQAQEQVSNQVATFYASVDAKDLSKDQALKQVNDLMTIVLLRLEKLGIPNEDIQTQSLNVYQSEDRDENGVVTKMWYASNGIQIVVKEQEKIAQVNDVLVTSDATNISGPNFQVDPAEAEAIKASLLSSAVSDAQSKAVKIAQGQGMQVKQIISVTEGGLADGGPMPYGRMMADAGGAPMQAGSSDLTASVVVVFEME